MNRPSAGSLALSTLLCCLLAAAVFLLTSILSAPQELLASMLRRYAIHQALLRTLESLPALSIAGSLVTFTLFARPGQGVTLQQVVRPALVVLMVLALGYLLADALAVPWLRRSVAGMEEDSRRAAAFRVTLDAARARAEAGGSVEDWTEARDSATRYLAIDPADEDMARLENELHEALLVARDRVSAAPPPAPPAMGEPESAKPADLIRMAEDYLAREDYYSAHYYASLAQATPEVAARASQLVAAADEKITPRTPLDRKATPEETEARLLAQRKREAYGIYQSQDWIGAYYRFGELAVLHPDDPDIQRFHASARAKALEAAFDREEAVTALLEPGTQGILYVAAAGKDVEVTSIGRMVRLSAGTYFSDVETLRYRPGVGVTLHVWAPYGKLAGDRIILRALDATRREDTREPVVLVAPEGDEPASILRPAYPLALLEHIRPNPRVLRGVPVPTLWRLRSEARASGVLAEALDLEIILFFTRPALFLALGLAGVGLAMRYRGRYFGRPALAAYASLGLFPFAMSGLWGLLVDGGRLVYGVLLAVAGFVPTVVAAATAQGLLLVVGLVVLSRSALE